jgi:hypothetical protein
MGIESRARRATRVFISIYNNILIFSRQSVLVDSAVTRADVSTA